MPSVRVPSTYQTVRSRVTDTTVAGPSLPCSCSRGRTVTSPVSVPVQAKEPVTGLTMPISRVMKARTVATASADVGRRLTAVLAVERASEPVITPDSEPEGRAEEPGADVEAGDEGPPFESCADDGAAAGDPPEEHAARAATRGRAARTARLVREVRMRAPSREAARVAAACSRASRPAGRPVIPLLTWVSFTSRQSFLTVRQGGDPGGGGSMPAYLELRSGAGAKPVALNRAPLSFGREPHNDLPLRDD